MLLITIKKKKRDRHVTSSRLAAAPGFLKDTYVRCSPSPVRLPGGTMNCDYGQHPRTEREAESTHIPGNAGSSVLQNTFKRRRRKQPRLDGPRQNPHHSFGFLVQPSKCISSKCLSMRCIGAVEAHRSMYRGLSHRPEKCLDNVGVKRTAWPE